MNIHTGTFSKPHEHHDGWFKVYRFGARRYEIWFGTKYLTIQI